MPDPEIIISALDCLTQREAEAVLWIAQGKTSWEAGRILGVAEGTINAHAAHASEKLQASNRAHLVARAFVRGILAVAPRLSCLVLALACSLDAHDALRSPRRPGRPRRRDDTEQVVSADEGDRARRRPPYWWRVAA